MITILVSLYQSQSGRKYLRVCNSIEQAISAEKLKPGEQLPPQRDLADSLGVTLGTVTRGYQEAKKRGLLVGETGRGTFVRQRDNYTLHSRHNSPETRRAAIPFDLNFPLVEEQPDLDTVLLALRKSGNHRQLLSYQKSAGMNVHREAALPWLRGLGLDVGADRVFITSGGQHSIHTVLLARGPDSGCLGVESFTYPGVIQCSRMLGCSLVSVPMDNSGMLPDALDAACRQHRLTGIYLMPSNQNPTAGIMPTSRRQELVEVARRFDLFVLEDDVYGPLQTNRLPPLQTLAPERTYYFTNLSKGVAPGLRVAYLVVPSGKERFVETAIAATVWMTPPLMAEIASRWLENGEVQRVIGVNQRAVIRRLSIVEDILGTDRFQANPGGLHIWLPLPPQWQGEAFVAQAQQRGVAVLPSVAFTADRQPQMEAVRICIGAPQTDALVREGISIIAELLDETPNPAPVIL